MISFPAMQLGATPRYRLLNFELVNFTFFWIVSGIFALSYWGWIGCAVSAIFWRYYVRATNRTGSGLLIFAQGPLFRHRNILKFDLLSESGKTIFDIRPSLSFSGTRENSNDINFLPTIRGWHVIGRTNMRWKAGQIQDGAGVQRLITCGSIERWTRVEYQTRIHSIPLFAAFPFPTTFLPPEITRQTRQRRKDTTTFPDWLRARSGWHLWMKSGMIEAK